MHLTLTAGSALDFASGNAQILRGLALPFDSPGRTSAGIVQASAGSRLSWPTDPRRIKVFSDHGRRRPVGYLRSITREAGGISVEMQLANTRDGNNAYTEAREGVRDAISVELDQASVDSRGNITGGEIVAVALVPLPAFADARIAASRHTVDPDPDADDTDEGADDGDSDDDDSTEGEPAPQIPEQPKREGTAKVKRTTTEEATGTTETPPGTLNARMRGATLTAARSISLADVGRRLETVYRADPRAESVNAALADIVPANDAAGRGILTPQWLGELWVPRMNSRDYINSIQSGELTGMHFFGYRWKETPEVDDYAGNKTEIPTSPASLEPVTGDAYRLAGGWDVDRIFYDLGAPGFLGQILDFAADDLKQKQEDKVGAAIRLAAVNVPAAPAVSDLFGALSVLAGHLGSKGARVNGVAVAPNLFGELLAIPANTAPWWMSQGSNSINLQDQTATVAGFRAFVDVNLPAGTVMAWDSRAGTFYEPRTNPIRVQAINLPNGGIDVAVYGYQGHLIHQPQTIVKITVTTTP